MRSLAEFDAFFAATIAPRLRELESLRRMGLVKAVLASAGIVALCLFALFFIAGDDILEWLFFLFVGGCGAIAFAVSYCLAGYKAAFKDGAIRPIVRFYDEQCAYSPDGFIPESEFRACGLFPRAPDRYRGDDLIEGQIGQTAFRCSEIHAEYKTEFEIGSYTRTSWHTIFRGVFFVADFNKDFHGQTFIFPDRAEHLLGAWLGAAVQKMTGPGELVKLEDVEFEKLFAVYSDNQVEARYILSQSLMQRLVAYRTKRRREMHFAFIGSRLIAAISLTENLFEPPILGSVMNPGMYRVCLTELDSILSIVEDLNLNLRIWTKE